MQYHLISRQSSGAIISNISQGSNLARKLGKGLIRLHLCAGWSEPLLVTHITLLEISCQGSICLLSSQNLNLLASNIH